MNFAGALIHLKAGAKMGRTGWNGKGMYVVLMPGYPAGVHPNVETRKAHKMIDNEPPVVINPYFAMRHADGSIGNWTATHMDLLSTDWEIVN